MERLLQGGLERRGARHIVGRLGDAIEDDWYMAGVLSSCP